MKNKTINKNHRRRTIKLMAAGAAALALPGNTLAAILKNDAGFFRWHGQAMGAEISLQLFHGDGAQADRIIRGAIKIIKDMESIFSLYKPESIISRLNSQGILHQPPAEFTDLLLRANNVSRLTSGAFDITVQPLWQYYKSRFLDVNSDEGWVPDRAFRTARALVGYENLFISQEMISFNKPNMALTLNGIAQGYITDVVSDYFKNEGMTSVLVDIGEYRALGPQANNSPWRIALADPENIGGISHIVEMRQGAIATSSGTGDIFDIQGRHHHLLDPHSGYSANKYMSVTVTAPDATTADALSTAFFSMAEGHIKKYIENHPSVTARLTYQNGKVTSF